MDVSQNKGGLPPFFLKTWSAPTRIPSKHEKLISSPPVGGLGSVFRGPNSQSTRPSDSNPTTNPTHQIPPNQPPSQLSNQPPTQPPNQPTNQPATHPPTQRESHVRTVGFFNPSSSAPPSSCRAPPQTSGNTSRNQKTLSNTSFTAKKNKINTTTKATHTHTQKKNQENTHPHTQDKQQTTYAVKKNGGGILGFYEKRSRKVARLHWP